MVRFFDLYEEKSTAKLTIEDKSMAAVATVEQFEKTFKTKLREVDESEYEMLTEAYTSEVQNANN